MNLSDDPRWRRLHRGEWTCPCCGLQHAGVFDLGCERPDCWPADGPRLANAAVGTSQHFLSADFCVMDGEHFFVRGVIPIPIRGSGGASFGYGAWASLSQRNFEGYVQGFGDGRYGGGEQPWFGWLSNDFPGYPPAEPQPLKCHVQPRQDRQRPTLELEPTDHPLAVEQREGITFDRLLAIYAINGHDIRSALCE